MPQPKVKVGADWLPANGGGVTSIGNRQGNIPMDTAPTADNTNGYRIGVLSSEPATKYAGWIYFITES